MTLTHLSHFGLEKIGETADNVVFSGTLGSCKRMAFAHGMEIEKYEGRILSSVNGHAIHAPVSESNPTLIWFKGGGLILKGRDDYSLVMPLKVWKND